MALLLGISVLAVRHRRLRLGIRKVTRRYKQRKFTPEEDALLGTAPDKEIAKRLGRHPNSVQSRRLKLGIEWVNPKKKIWTKEELKDLGKFPDEVLARQFDRTEHAIRSKRGALYIPKCRPQPGAPS